MSTGLRPTVSLRRPQNGAKRSWARAYAVEAAPISVSPRWKWRPSGPSTGNRIESPRMLVKSVRKSVPS